MRKFYHQKEIKISKEYKYNEYEFNLDIPSTYGFSYYKNLDKKIEEFFEPIEESKMPTLFRIKGNFDLLKEVEDEDRIYFIVAVINIFVSHIIKQDKFLDREKRLSSPKSLDSLNLNLMTKKSIVNKEILFPIFSLEILDNDGNIVYEVFEDEDTSNDSD